MIDLDFSISDDWNEGATNLAGASELDLRFGLLLGDVVFRVGSADYSALWGWVPILDFALSISEIEREVRQCSGVRVFEFTESEAQLRFEPLGSLVRVSSSYNSAQSDVAGAEFSAAVEDFRKRVLHESLRRFPSLGSSEVFRKLFEDWNK